MSVMRFLMFLALAAWIGALIFFPIVAQTAFTVLPSQHLAGLVVRNSLIPLHWMGVISGVVFLCSSLAYSRLAEGRANPFRASHLVVAMMLGLTAFLQLSIIPRMDALRASAGEIASLSPGDPIRAQFDTLHARSTRLEEVVLVSGIILLYLTSRRMATRA